MGFCKNPLCHTVADRVSLWIAGVARSAGVSVLSGHVIDCFLYRHTVADVFVCVIPGPRPGIQVCDVAPDARVLSFLRRQEVKLSTSFSSVNNGPETPGILLRSIAPGTAVSNEDLIMTPLGKFLSDFFCVCFKFG